MNPNDSLHTPLPWHLMPLSGGEFLIVAEGAEDHLKETHYLKGTAFIGKVYNDFATPADHQVARETGTYHPVEDDARAQANAELLLAGIEALAQKRSATCETCRFWKVEEWMQDTIEDHNNVTLGFCQHPMLCTTTYAQGKLTLAGVYSPDEGGITGKLVTGPRFGCVHHAQLNEPPPKPKPCNHSRAVTVGRPGLTGLLRHKVCPCGFEWTE